LKYLLGALSQRWKIKKKFVVMKEKRCIQTRKGIFQVFHLLIKSYGFGMNLEIFEMEVNQLRREVKQWQQISKFPSVLKKMD